MILYDTIRSLHNHPNGLGLEGTVALSELGHGLFTPCTQTAQAIGTNSAFCQRLGPVVSGRRFYIVGQGRPCLALAALRNIR